MNTLTTKGVFEFNVEDRTRKHAAQSVWKTSAIIKLDPDVQEYYQWFLRKRYSLELQKSLRSSHVTFINDRTSEIDMVAYEKIKSHFQGTEIEIVLGLDPRSSGKHWWLNVPEENRTDIHAIRNLVGLGRPNFGLHMTIGIAMGDLRIAHSEYITKLLTNKMIP